MGKELSHGDYKDPKKQIDDAFKDMRKGMEKKLREELGPHFASDFIQRIHDAVANIPEIPTPWGMRAQIEKIAKDLLEEHKTSVMSRVDEMMRGRITEIIKQVWIDFIRKEIDNKFNSMANIVAIAKKIKELP